MGTARNHNLIKMTDKHPLEITEPPANIQELIEASMTGEPDDIWMEYQACLPSNLTREEIRIIHGSFMAMLEENFLL